MENLIELSNVTLTYPPATRGIRKLFSKQAKNSHALKDVTFVLPKGQSLALIGLNGSGKSSLLRVLARIYHPDSGVVKVNGRTAALFNLGIGMRMDLTGRSNIMLMGMVSGFSRKMMLELTPGIIEFSELADVIDNPIHTYSQGMAMRLSFATATAINPEILLLDEWIGAGDSIFRQKAEKRLDGMVRKANGFVLASHNTAIVKRYCQKAIWLHEGECKLIGNVDYVIDEFNQFTSK